MSLKTPLAPIGEIDCPVCGDTECHVKETKKGRAMVHCEACQYQGFTRSAQSDRLTRARMRPVGQSKPTVRKKAGDPPKLEPKKV